MGKAAAHISWVDVEEGQQVIELVRAGKVALN
jgi:hypothetical protein